MLKRIVFVDVQCNVICELVHCSYPKGSVLYLTSPEEPATCVGKLIHKQKSSSIVLSGQYRVVGNKV